jgi:hypothetical protein
MADPLAPITKAARRIRKENPILAAAFSEDDVVKAIIRQIATNETTLEGAVVRALRNGNRSGGTVTGGDIVAKALSNPEREARFAKSREADATTAARKARTVKESNPHDLTAAIRKVRDLEG